MGEKDVLQPVGANSDASEKRLVIFVPIMVCVTCTSQGMKKKSLLIGLSKFLKIMCH